MALGEMANVSQEERDEFYRTIENYYPTTIQSARRLARVQWLEQLNSRYRFRKILDLCCNDGFGTRFLLQSPVVERLVGIDLNESAIAGAKKLAVEEGYFPEVSEYYNQSIFEWEDYDHFDCVVCFETIEHFMPEDQPGLIEFIDSKLESGGRAYMSTPDVFGQFGETNPDPTHIGLLSAEQVKDLMVDAIGVDVQVYNWAECLHWTWDKP